MKSAPHESARIRWYCMGFLLFLIFSFTCFGEAVQRSSKVLVLYSYHPGDNWEDSVAEGINTFFEAYTDIIDLSINYMDTKRYRTPAYLKTMKDFYRFKFGREQFDVVLAVDNNSLQFVVNNREEIFPDTPVVFCGVNFFEHTMLKGQRGITGVSEEPSYRELLETILTLTPPTEKIIVIGSTQYETGRIDRELVLQLVPEFEKHVDFEFWDNLPYEELIVRLSGVGDKTSILLNSHVKDKKGNTVSYEELIRTMHQKTYAPMYDAWEYLLGHGMIGGKLVDGYSHGDIASQMVYDILHGTPANDIPVRRGEANVYMFDYNELRRFDIPLSHLPEGAIIRNKPNSIYYKYKEIIWAVTVVIFFLSVSIIVLLMNIQRRKHAEAALIVQRDFAMMISSIRERSKAFERLSEMTVRIEGVNACLMYTVGNSGELALASAYGIAASSMEKLAHLSRNTELAQAIKTKRPIYSPYSDTPFTDLKVYIPGSPFLSVGILPVLENNILSALIIVCSEEYAKLPERSTQTLETIAAYAGNVVARIQADENLKKSQERYKQLASDIETELHSKKEGIIKAQRLQKSLNTVKMPLFQKINVMGVFIPSEELGGDFFDVRNIDNKLIIIAADCMGHGIEVSMHATLLKSISDRYIDIIVRGLPDEFLSRVNQDAMTYFQEQNFPVMFAAMLDIESRRLTYASANYEQPYLISNKIVIPLAGSNGYHLGYKSDTRYERASLEFNEGDTLFIYSDALVEIQRNNDILLKRDQIESMLKNFGHGAKKDLRYFTHEIESLHPFPLEDDTTFILVETQPPVTKQYTFSSFDEMMLVEEDIDTLLVRYGFDEENIPMIRVCFEEIAVNAILHGNKSDLTKKATANITVNFEKITIVIQDEGEGFNPKHIPDPTDMKRFHELMENGYEDLYHGRGIWIVREYMDELEYNSKGNRAHMVKTRTVPRAILGLDKFKEKEHTPPYIEGNKIVWEESLRVDTVKKMKDKTVNIDFSLCTSLSSQDIGKLLTIIKAFEQTNQKIECYFLSQSLIDILTKLGISSSPHIVIVK